MASKTPVLVSVPEDVLLEAVAALGAAQSLRYQLNREFGGEEGADDVFHPAAIALRDAAFPGLDELDDEACVAHPAFGGVWDREVELWKRVRRPFDEFAVRLDRLTANVEAIQEGMTEAAGLVATLKTRSEVRDA